MSTKIQLPTHSYLLGLFSQAAVDVWHGSGITSHKNMCFSILALISMSGSQWILSCQKGYCMVTRMIFFAIFNLIFLFFSMIEIQQIFIHFCLYFLFELIGYFEILVKYLQHVSFQGPPLSTRIN